MIYQQCQLFHQKDSLSWKEYLDKYGYVVIQNILSPNELVHAKNLFIQDIHEVSPNLNFEDSSSLTIENTPCMFGKGMAVFNGFGQCNAMWNLRLNKNILEIFQSLYNTKDLAVSLDGFSLFVSSEQKSKPWLHIDQNPVNKFSSIQGAFNILPVTEKSSGFIVIPESHKSYHPNVDHTKDWIICSDQVSLMEKAIKLLIPENCLVLWNSKVIHANVGMADKRKQLDRITAFLTYQPKTVRTEKILNQRIQAYYKKQSTSHWIHKCEIKKYPWGFKNRYEKKNFGNIQLTLDKNGEIPIERLALL